MGKFLSSLPVNVTIIPTRKLVFKLKDDVVYESDTYGTFKTPKGFITDLASIPGWLPLSLQTGDLSPAAIIHDGLYAFQQCTKEIADKVFLEAALTCNVPLWKAKTFYLAVKWFGFIAWNKNAKIKNENKQNDI